MDLPLQYKRWIATKVGKAKKADVYFKNYSANVQKTWTGRCVKGVTDTSIKLDRGYRTNYRSFCNWEHTIYRWRYEF